MFRLIENETTIIKKSKWGKTERHCNRSRTIEINNPNQNELIALQFINQIPIREHVQIIDGVRYRLASSDDRYLIESGRAKLQMIDDKFWITEDNGYE